MASHTTPEIDEQKVERAVNAVITVQRVQQDVLLGARTLADLHMFDLAALLRSTAAYLGAAESKRYVRLMRMLNIPSDEVQDAVREWGR